VTSTPHESVHRLSGAYVVDALDDDERSAFEEHLPGCRDCQEEVASLREAASLMADDAATTPPPSLRDSVLAGISTIRPLPPETPDVLETPAPGPAETSVVVPMRRRRRFRLAAIAAAAAVLAVIGVGAVYEPWKDDAPQVAAVTPADRVLAADDAKKVRLTFEDGSEATLVRSISEGRAVLLTTDMAAPPPGKVFELWFQDDAGAMHPAGLMSTGGNHKVLLKGDATAATGVGITIEPEGGSPEPTSEPVALFDLSKARA
jgi:anti-sigma-K factor RskA